MDRNWIFSGQKYPFDISDAECLERMSSVFSSIRGDNEEDESALTPAEKAAKTCNAIRSFFSVIFGEDASRDICGERQSAARCSEAYLDFIAFLGEQIDEFSKIREAVEERYSSRAAALQSPDCGA